MCILCEFIDKKHTSLELYIPEPQRMLLESESFLMLSLKFDLDGHRTNFSHLK